MKDYELDGLEGLGLITNEDVVPSFDDGWVTEMEEDLKVLGLIKLNEDVTVSGGSTKSILEQLNDLKKETDARIGNLEDTIERMQEDINSLYWSKEEEF